MTDEMEALEGQDAGQDAGEDEQEQEQPDVSALLKEIKSLRRENAKWRTQLRGLEEEREAKRKAAMTELERLQVELKEAEEARALAERQRQQIAVRSQVISAAAKAGFNDPEDAYRLLSGDTLEVSEDGKVNGLSEALKALLKDKPYLAKQSSNYSPTNPAGGAAKQSDEEILREIYGGGRSTLFTGQGGGVFWANQTE